MEPALTDVSSLRVFTKSSFGYTYMGLLILSTNVLGTTYRELSKGVLFKVGTSRYVFVQSSYYLSFAASVDFYQIEQWQGCHESPFQKFAMFLFMKKNQQYGLTNQPIVLLKMWGNPFYYGAAWFYILHWRTNSKVTLDRVGVTLLRILLLQVAFVFLSSTELLMSVNMGDQSGISVFYIFTLQRKGDNRKATILKHAKMSLKRNQFIFKGLFRLQQFCCNRQSVWPEKISKCL